LISGFKNIFEKNDIPKMNLLIVLAAVIPMVSWILCGSNSLFGKAVSFVNLPE
jgi:hypothetical protein